MKMWERNRFATYSINSITEERNKETLEQVRELADSNEK